MYFPVSNFQISMNVRRVPVLAVKGLIASTVRVLTDVFVKKVLMGMEPSVKVNKTVFYFRSISVDRKTLVIVRDASSRSFWHIKLL